MSTLNIRGLMLRRWAPVALACLFCVASLPLQAETVIIVHPSNANALDVEKVSKIFLRQIKTFPDGSSASPVNQKDGPVSDEFREKILKKNAAQFRAYWAQQLFTGSAKPIQELSDDDAVLKFVAETPNGIGYVNASKVTPSVKAVR